MNILIVSEKPSLSRAIAQTARAHWPLDTITFVHAVPYGNFKFNYPRGLRLQDYPRVSEPVHTLNDWETWCCGGFDMDAAGTLAQRGASKEMFLEADSIIYACDPDHTGAISFEVLMREVFGDDRAQDCPALAMCSFVQGDVERAFAQMAPFGPTFPESLAYGRMKRYFDWNWNVNALAVLGEVQRRVGVPTGAPMLSKYSLQLLYALRGSHPIFENAAYTLMHKWPGTGRYQYEPGQWRPRLGSPASISTILENLVEAGLLDRLNPTKNTRLAVSARGLALLALLHPDCEDLDIPFRLHDWCEKGAAAKSAVDRYIKTFFGKQLRFMAR